MWPIHVHEYLTQWKSLDFPVKNVEIIGYISTKSIEKNWTVFASVTSLYDNLTARNVRFS